MSCGSWCSSGVSKRVWLRLAQQPGIAHPEDLAYCHLGLLLSAASVRRACIPVYAPAAGCASSSSRPASSITRTPSSWPCRSLLPASAPATTQCVFRADQPATLAPAASEHRLGLVAAERGQRAGQHEGLASQRQLRRNGRLALAPVHASSARLLHHLAVVRLAEEGADAVRDDGADVGRRNCSSPASMMASGCRNGARARQVASPTWRMPRPNRKRASVVLRDCCSASTRFCADLSAMRSARRAAPGSAGRGRQGLDQAGIDQLLDQFVAQALDVERARCA